MTTKDVNFRPNYTAKCQNCGQTPTVDIMAVAPDGVESLATKMMLCGPCCWGEADTIDPETW